MHAILLWLIVFIVQFPSTILRSITTYFIQVAEKQECTLAHSTHTHRYSENVSINIHPQCVRVRIVMKRWLRFCSPACCSFNWHHILQLLRLLRELLLLLLLLF